MPRSGLEELAIYPIRLVHGQTHPMSMSSSRIDAPNTQKSFERASLSLNAQTFGTYSILSPKAEKELFSTFFNKKWIFLPCSGLAELAIHSINLVHTQTHPASIFLGRIDAPPTQKF